MIELLVVIAIIGILSAVVLASLSTARSKGKDAAAMQALEGARAQAELYYYANGNSYNNVCGQTAVGGVKTVGAQVLSAARAEGYAFDNSVNGSGDWNNHQVNNTNKPVTCNDSGQSSPKNPNAWAAAIYLSNGTFFCTDSTGLATTTTTSAYQITDNHDNDCSP